MTIKSNTSRPFRARSSTGKAGPPPHANRPLDVRVTPERISQRAYECFVDRGANAGGELSDWLQAERELREACERALREFADPGKKVRR